MVDVAKVSMFGIPVGIFNWDDRYGVARFEYDQSFIGRGLEPSPLMMPVRGGRVYSFANLVSGAAWYVGGFSARHLWTCVVRQMAVSDGSHKWQPH